MRNGPPPPGLMAQARVSPTGVVARHPTPPPVGPVGAPPVMRIGDPEPGLAAILSPVLLLVIVLLAVAKIAAALALR